MSQRTQSTQRTGITAMCKSRLMFVRSAVAAMMLLGTTAGAWAGNTCAGYDQTIALRTAAIQQRLMVAALSCHQTGLYNRFVMHYRGALQHSDAVLRRYFEGHGGVKAYHTYKTKQANAASLESIHDIKHYCIVAQRAFAAAFKTPSTPLSHALDIDHDRDTACHRDAMMASRAVTR